MDLVEQVAALKASNDELVARVATIENALTKSFGAMPETIAKHFRKVDYVLDMYFGNEVIKFNDAEAAAAAASASEAAVAAASGAAS